MSKGFDCTSDLTPYGQAIKDAGYSFCARYYYSGISHAKVKLSRAEALHLSGMGIYLVSVFEDNPTSAGYFSEQRGMDDGRHAFGYAAIGVQQPQGTPIYFTVDYDATPQDLTATIVPYFRSVRESRGSYLVGVYGSGLVCRTLKELGLVSYSWLAQSTGWAEYEQYKQSNQWNLLQLWTTDFHGLSIDPLISNGNGGGFLVK